MTCYSCGRASHYNAGRINVYDSGRSIMPPNPTFSYNQSTIDYSQLPGNLGMKGDYKAAE